MDRRPNNLADQRSPDAHRVTGRADRASSVTKHQVNRVISQMFYSSGDNAMLLRCRLAWAALPLIAALLACAVPGSSQPTSTLEPTAQTVDSGGLLTPDSATIT